MYEDNSNIYRTLCLRASNTRDYLLHNVEFYLNG